ncbi:UDP-N-acetylglucosamine 2-epimerase-like protein [Leptospira weilii str. UI 13098]|uniref:UDP-N-acetylglucosamine 2-epimerase-like protein n=1 Tax=Leptospira weilii str. UI 13098 TaxID=1088542 RepID=M6Q5Y3_9LEPT|nr:UDP-N-acetylglucosamine 2-epimerase-like protein [Leptospira weilii str. UI 13098]
MNCYLFATACTVYNIPLAHISGGEITQGSQDNQIRHALTKLAHIHFPATEEYKENIMSLGEEEWRICVSGEPGLDLLKNMNFLPKSELYEMLGLNLEKKLIICTFHPETISNRIIPAFVKKVLEEIVNVTNYQILITASNIDRGGREINNLSEQMA